MSGIQTPVSARLTLSVFLQVLLVVQGLPGVESSLVATEQAQAVVVQTQPLNTTTFEILTLTIPRTRMTLTVVASLHQVHRSSRIQARTRS